ncbi:MAG TPA: 50S ribosomal protein L6 [Alphaproteobacteria bacterium]|jgi:large subunit ribosomal protein L6|nr:50S ribosomal protein L6 [Alphaproteobacteria bacterium]
MSRVGRAPVAIPEGVTVAITGQNVIATGKGGRLSMILGEEVSAEVKDGKVVVTPREMTKRGRMVWGLSRNLVKNLVTGVAEGFKVNLEINGVGYRAALQGKNLNLQLGFSHDVIFPIPEGITIKCDKPTAISISGADRHLVGQVAANIRALKKPEPYKGKGIKYETETVRRKEGKKK